MCLKQVCFQVVVHLSVRSAEEITVMQGNYKNVSTIHEESQNYRLKSNFIEETDGCLICHKFGINQ